MIRSTLSPARKSRSIITCILPSLIIFSVLLVSCGTGSVKRQERQAGEPVIVAGHLPDLVSREIKTKINGLEYKTTADTVGRFRMVLDLAHPCYPRFKGINTNLYLVPGDSLYITTQIKSSGNEDTGADSPFRFSGGESGLINTYYAGVDAELQALLDTVDIKKYYSQEPVPYRDLNTRIISDWTETLDRFATENPGIGRDYITLEKERIRHYWLYELNVYFDENKAYTGKAPELPDDFYDYLATVRLNDTMLFMFPGYRYFLYSWVDLQARLAGNPRKGYRETHHLLDIVENNITEPVIRTDVLQEVLKKQTSRMKVDEEVIARAERLGAGEKFLEMIRKNVGVLSSLTSGNPAPDFEILDHQGNTSSLKDFSGKYLLIDIWSTTCSPCIREFPGMEDIKHEMEGRNLEIIAVCLSNEDQWKAKMQQLNLPAEGQYRAEKGWSSQFSKDYLKFSGVPVYIIIDPEGKIVTARAPYPSRGLKELLEELPV